MNEELATAKSLLWMIEQVMARGEFTYSKWAIRFRDGDDSRQSRQDRKFHHHLRFFREEVLPVMVGTSDASLQSSEGRYYLEHRLDGESFQRIADPQGANFLPFLHGLNSARSLMPFPAPRIEKQLVDDLDINEDTLGRILYKNASQWRFKPKFLDTFLDALHSGSKLLVRPERPRSPSTVTPLFLVSYDGAWYLLGLGETLQQFNLSRVADLSISDEPAQPISKTQIKRLRESVESTFGAFLVTDWKSPSAGAVVTIRYGGASFIYALERFDPKHWAPGDPWFELDRQENWADVSLKVHSYTEVLAEVLRWGIHAEALAPESFRQAWIENLRAFSGRLNGIERETGTNEMLSPGYSGHVRIGI